MMRLTKESIPWAMAGGRAVLGAALIAGERCNWSGIALAFLVVTAVVSDIFDGILARRWRCDTPGVRLFDSMADTVFYVCVAVALWIGQPHIWRDNRWLLGTLLALEAARFAFDFAKFGKPASYHSYLAKTWGLVMGVAVVATFARHTESALLPVALLLGIAADVEGLMMSLVLPVWRRDVKWLRAAWQFRGELRKPVTARQAQRAGIATTAVLLALAIGIPAFALDTGQAVYVGGSASVAENTPGTLDTSSPTALLFRFKKPDGTLSELAIDYAKIRTAEKNSPVRHHLGVLPAIGVGLVAARQHRYLLNLTWSDAAGVVQAAEFEMAKQQQETVMAVVRARMPQPCPRIPNVPCVRPANPASTTPMHQP